MNENETSEQKNEQIKEQDEEEYDMSGTIIFSIFERHKYNLMEIKYLEKKSMHKEILNLNTLFLQLQFRNG